MALWLLETRLKKNKSVAISAVEAQLIIKAQAKRHLIECNEVLHCEASRQFGFSYIYIKMKQYADVSLLDVLSTLSHYELLYGQ